MVLNPFPVLAGVLVHPRLDHRAVRRAYAKLERLYRAHVWHHRLVCSDRANRRCYLGASLRRALRDNLRTVILVNW